MAKNIKNCGFERGTIMVKTRVDDEIAETTIKAKIRLDYKGFQKPGKFFFGGKDTEEVADETRTQQVGILRNVPLQGITIEEVDMSGDIYTVLDDINSVEVAYAPVILTLTADSLEDIVRFIAKEEFRRIEIIEPDNMALTKTDIERIFFKMSEEFQGYRQVLERKYSSK